MTRTELIGVTRTLSMATQQLHAARRSNATWEWAATPVFFPESHCPYCKGIMRSPGIWFLSGERYNRLHGVLIPRQGGKVELLPPRHAHELSCGILCLGLARDGIALLSNTPYLGNLGMPRITIPWWINTYWHHYCPQMVTYLKDQGWDYKVPELIVL